ncbi:Smg-4/UPF3 family-domain-containing protein [Syncephalis plumigaleata]|nr:Smg-4/UPF3 family-domain-containing protein [Syncephalis plumigaleata]
MARGGYRGRGGRGRGGAGGRRTPTSHERVVDKTELSQGSSTASKNGATTVAAKAGDTSQGSGTAKKAAIVKQDTATSNATGAPAKSSSELKKKKSSKKPKKKATATELNEGGTPAKSSSKRTAKAKKKPLTPEEEATQRRREEKRERERERRRQRAARRAKERQESEVAEMARRTKVITIFYQAASEWLPEDAVEWKMYYPGKIATSRAKENQYSRAYICFHTIEQMAAFHKGFDGHLFIDSKGEESYAIVEYAPYQKIPRERSKVDHHQGTIDKDPDYIAFVKRLEEIKENGDVDDTALSMEEEESALPTEGKDTPLLEHLREQKALVEARKRERRARSAHAKAASKAAERAARANKSKSDSRPPKPVKLAKRPPATANAPPKILLKRPATSDDSNRKSETTTKSTQETAAGGRSLNIALNAALQGGNRGKNTTKKKPTTPANNTKE